MTFDIPGYRTLTIDHLVFDYNGTLAVDGVPAPGMKERLVKLSEQVKIHVITADTFGKAKQGLEGVDCELSIMGADNQDSGKLAFVRSLGADRCACFGNGRNDRFMLKEAALGVAILLEEGMCVDTLLCADVLVKDINDGLDLLLNPLRLTATLRS